MINKLNKVKKNYDHYIGHDSMGFSAQTKTNPLYALSAGIYGLVPDQAGNIWFVPQSTMTDELINLPDSISEKITKEVQKFWLPETAAKFDKYGVVYKRGILLFGEPGTGKTCTIAQIMANTIKDGGVILFNPNPQLLNQAVTQIRQIEPNIKVLVVYEEVDNYINDHSFLSLLDGELQIDNIVYIATTNYIQRIPDRLKNRPGRFATVIEVPAPSREMRRAYLEKKLLLPELSNIDVWVDATEGMVIDQIKDLVVSVCCLDLSLEESVQKINSMGNLSTEEESEEGEEFRGEAELYNYFNGPEPKEVQEFQFPTLNPAIEKLTPITNNKD